MSNVVASQNIPTATPQSGTGDATAEENPYQHEGPISEGDCPPPLAWQDVLREVSDAAEPWRIERDGAVISGRRFGSGPPLFFLNGVLGNWELFALTMWLVREEFQTIVIETSPLTGRLPRRRLSADALADDLFAAADDFDFREIAVFAASFGGLTALSAMRQQPGRIRRSILQAGCAHIPMTFSERAMLGLGRCWPGRLSSVPLFNRIQFENHHRWFPPFDESRWEFLGRNISDTRAADCSARLAALRTTDLRPVLPSIQTPILLVQGEGESKSVCDREAALREGLPHAETKKLAHCGHFPFVTHPHILSRELKEFLLPAENSPSTDAKPSREQDNRVSHH